MTPLVLMLRRLHGLIVKEFQAIFSDLASRVILFAPVILQAVIFGYGATFELEHVPWALWDGSHSPVSERLVRAVDAGAGSGAAFRRVATVSSMPELERIVDRGEALIGVAVSPECAREAARGKPCPVLAVLDARNSTTAGVALGYLTAAAAAAGSEGAQAPFTLVERTLHNPNEITRWNIMTGLIVTLSMIQVMLLAGLSVAREREQGTFDMLRMTPLTSAEILVGKAVPPVVIGVAQSGLILCVTLFWFRIPMSGSLLDLFLVTVLFTVSCVGIGLSVSAVARTMQEAMVGVFLLLLPFVLLSGVMTPVAAMPQWLQECLVIDPLAWAVQAVRRIYLEGATFADVAGLLSPVIGTGMLTLPLAAWLFGRKVF